MPAKWNWTIPLLTMALIGCSTSPRPQAVDPPPMVELRPPPDTPENRVMQAQAMLYQGNLGAAQEHLDAAIRKDPKCARAYELRGPLNESQGFPVAAGEDYDRAIELAPQNAINWLRRGTFLAQKDWPKALEDLNRAVDLAPEDARVWRGRAKKFEERGQLGLALRDYSEAIRLQPTGSDLIARAALLEKQGAILDARADYEAALKSSDPAAAEVARQHLAPAESPTPGPEQTATPTPTPTASP